MTLLTFPLVQVLRLCNHALRATSWGTPYAHGAAADDRSDDAGEPTPCLWLVGDEGVYLMSNGRPPLLEADKPVVVYALGCNPRLDPGARGLKIAAFGGDDGVEELPWCKAIVDLAGTHPKAQALRVDISGSKITLEGVA